MGDRSQNPCPRRSGYGPACEYPEGHAEPCFSSGIQCDLCRLESKGVNDVRLPQKEDFEKHLRRVHASFYWAHRPHE